VKKQVVYSNTREDKTLVTEFNLPGLWFQWEDAYPEQGEHGGILRVQDRNESELTRCFQSKPRYC